MESYDRTPDRQDFADRPSREDSRAVTDNYRRRSPPGKILHVPRTSIVHLFPLFVADTQQAVMIDVVVAREGRGLLPT
jgi:hypothetical protein